MQFKNESDSDAVNDDSQDYVLDESNMNHGKADLEAADIVEDAIQLTVDVDDELNEYREVIMNLFLYLEFL